jgi:hypothetical protein
VVGLQQTNDQLRHAVHSHATVDWAIGVLIAVHGIPPGAGFEVLPEPVRSAPYASVQRRAPGDVPPRPHPTLSR